MSSTSTSFIVVGLRVFVYLFSVVVCLNVASTLITYSGLVLFWVLFQDMCLFSPKNLWYKFSLLLLIMMIDATWEKSVSGSSVNI